MEQFRPKADPTAPYDILGGAGAMAPPAYTERDIIELMVRAPAVPEWFVPDMNGLGKAWIPAFEGSENRESHPMLKRSPEFYRQQTIQWPRAYAKMVLEAK